MEASHRRDQESGVGGNEKADIPMTPDQAELKKARDAAEEEVKIFVL